MKSYYQVKIVLDGDWISRVSAVRLINKIPEDAEIAYIQYLSHLNTSVIVFKWHRSV